MKRKIIKNILLFFSLFIFCAQVFSQAASVNADDPFYEDAMRWEQMGLTQRLPNLRPYPVHLVRSILEQVMGSDDERSKIEAEEHFERIFSRPIHIFLDGTGDVKLASADETKADYYAAIDLGAEGSWQITKMLSYAYDAEITARKNRWHLPYGSNLPKDAIFDPAVLGPFIAYTDINMGMGFGTDDIYVTGGLYRSGYGPFWESGFALNDASYHQANISFVFMRPKWNYVHQISAIGATNMNNDLSSLTFGKFMAFHAVEVNLLKTFSFSYYESIIWGKRFDFTYTLPIMFMTGQHINGAGDNLQMGLLLEYNPFRWMSFATDFFVDDFSVNDFVKFNFDARYKFGLHTGFIFTPIDFMIDKVSFDYTMQTPYLGAHWDYEGNSGSFSASTINYQNATNSGERIGSPLPPNSDRLSLGATIKPVKNLRIAFDMNYVRHANICESYTVGEAWNYLSNPKNKGLSTDGSETSSQMQCDANGRSVYMTMPERWGFLTQDDKMHIFQTGIKADYKIPGPKFLSLYVGAGYSFEYIKNAGVDRNIWVYNDKYSGGDFSEEEIAQFVESEKNRWKAALYDTVNNYFSLFVKIEW